MALVTILQYPAVALVSVMIIVTLVTVVAVVILVTVHAAGG